MEEETNKQKWKMNRSVPSQKTRSCLFSFSMITWTGKKNSRRQSNVLCVTSRRHCPSLCFQSFSHHTVPPPSSLFWFLRWRVCNSLIYSVSPRFFFLYRASARLTPCSRVSVACVFFFCLFVYLFHVLGPFSRWFKEKALSPSLT